MCVRIRFFPSLSLNLSLGCVVRQKKFFQISFKMDLKQAKCERIQINKPKTKSTAFTLLVWYIFTIERTTDGYAIPNNELFKKENKKNVFMSNRSFYYQCFFRSLFVTFFYLALSFFFILFLVNS